MYHCSATLFTSIGKPHVYDGINCSGPAEAGLKWLRRAGFGATNSRHSDSNDGYDDLYYIPLYIRHPRPFVTFEKSHLPVTWYCTHHLIYYI
jgi:hypothetical protein